jgi:hypothetical protein
LVLQTDLFELAEHYLSIKLGTSQQMNILSKSESQFTAAGPPQKKLKRASSNGSSGQLVRSASTATADSLTMSRADSSSAPAGEDDEATLATEGTMRTASSWTENGAGMAVGLEEDADDTGGMNDSSGSTDRMRKKLQHQLGVEAVLMLLKPADLEGTGLTAADDSVHRALEACEVRSKVDYIWYGCLKVNYFVRGTASALVISNLQLHHCDTDNERQSAT